MIQKLVEARKTVSDRETHVAQPLLLNDKQQDFKAKKFRHIFDQPLVRLIVWGKGRSG